MLETAICTAVSQVSSSICVSDPTALDCELIAVSEGFLQLSGYTREEVLGENCRFLSKGCPSSPEQRQRLRGAVATGAPFVAVLVNRRKSGEPFLNLLDLRGLVLGRHRGTGEELWVLLAMQMDVTEMM